jgi:hypothetical protein
MPFTLTPITVKDSAGANKPMIVYNDGTNSAFANAVVDSTGAVINPATSALQTTGNTSLSTIATNTTGIATAANQSTTNSSLATIATNTGSVSTNIGAQADAVASSDTGTFSLIALLKRGLQSLTSIATNTTGVATAANQTTGNSSLSTIATRTPALGSTTSANSSPVVIASDQAALPLPTGASTSALQTTGNTSLATIATNSGTQATAANQTSANTKLDTQIAALGAVADAAVTNPASSASIIAALKGILTGVNAATPAGSAIIGQVGINQTTPGTTNGVVVNAQPPVLYTGNTTTRPADTLVYAAGDLLANSTTAGSVTYPTIQVSRAVDQTATLLRMRLRKSGTVFTQGIFRVHLYNAQPTVSNGDNGVWLTNNVANYVGAFDITMTRAFTDGSIGIGNSSEGASLQCVPVSGQNYLFYLIEVRAAYTPISGEVFTPMIEVQ